jgi:hypothetical protein
LPIDSANGVNRFRCWNCHTEMSDE